MFECDVAHRRSVAVLCLLYKIRCNPMHPLNGALPGPYVPVRVTRGALVAHRYTYAPLRYRTSQYSRIFIPFSVSLWNEIIIIIIIIIIIEAYVQYLSVFYSKSVQVFTHSILYRSFQLFGLETRDRVR